MTETRRLDLERMREGLKKPRYTDHLGQRLFTTQDELDIAALLAEVERLSALLSEPQAAQEPQENVKHRGDLVRLVKRLRAFEHLDDAVNVAASAFKDTVAAVRAAASPVLPAPTEGEQP